MKWSTTKEGIVFVFDDERPEVAGTWNVYAEEQIEEKLSRRERFAEEEFRKPEHRHIITGLKRLNNGLTALKISWQYAGRQHALAELEQLLTRQHDIELEIEKIDNRFLREYVHELLDKMADVRRSLSEEVRWDVDAGKAEASVPDGLRR